MCLLPALVDLLKSQSDASEEYAACVTNADNKRTIGGFGAILHSRVAGGSRGVQGDAAMALYHLSYASINKGKLIKAGAVPIFLQDLQEESRLREERSLIEQFGCCSAVFKAMELFYFSTFRVREQRHPWCSLLVQVCIRDLCT